MADKKDWREKYKEKNSTGKESTTSNWRDKYKEYYDYASAKIVGEQVNNMLDAWQKNYNSYVTDYTNRFSKRKGSYEDAYVGDSLEWLNAETKKQSALKKQEDDILAYLNQYGGHLDSKWVKQVFDTIEQAKDAQYKIHTGATQDNKYWSSFGSEDLIGKYGSAQGAYEYYQRADGYEKKYEGLNAEDLKWAAGFLENGEEKEWMNSYIAQKDYAEKSEYDVAAGEAEIKEMEDYALWVINELKPYSGYHAEYQKRAEELFGKYGVSNAQEMKDLIDEKKRYISNSKRIQYNIAMSGVGDPTSEYYDPSFENYTDTSNIALLDIMKKFGGYKYMNSNERDTFAYYYNKYGAEKANEYLDSIAETLNYRKAERNFAKYKDQVFLEEVFAIEAGIDQAYTGLKNLFSDKDYIPTSSKQYLSGMIREDLKDDGFKLPDWMGGASGGQIVYDLLNTSANMAPSMLVGAAANVVVPGSGALVGAAMMGGSAAGNAYQEALNLGYDKGQARMYSTLVGASEAGLQYLMGGIGKLGGKLSGKAATTLASKFNSAYARLAVQYGTNMLSEGVEEYMQEILTPVFKNLALGTDEEIELITEEAIYSFLLGALTSGMGEITGITSNTGKSLPGHLIEMSALNKKNKQAAEMYSDATADLVKEGLESDSESEAHELAEMFKRKLDNGKEMSGYEIRQQIAANDDIARINNKLDATHEAAKRLKELGETSDVGKIASLVAKNAMGQKLTRDETSTLVRSKYGAQVAKEMRDSVAQEEKATYKPLEERVEAEKPAKVSDTGKTVVRATDDEIDLKSIKVKEISDDGVVLDVNGKDVDISEVDFATEELGSAFNALKKVEHITPTVASDMIAKIDTSKPIWGQMNGMDEAFTYGYWNYSEADLKAGLFASNLTKEQLNDAYKLGQYVRQHDVEADETDRKKMRTAFEAKMSKKEQTAQQKARIESDDVDVYFMDGETVEKFGDRKGYNEKRMAAVNTAKFLRKLGIGGKFVFYESYEKNGKRYFKDKNGVERPAPNGFYDPADGSIYIDLNAGNDGSGKALFTMGHELAHFVKHRSEKQFKILSDMVADAFDKTSLSMHKRVLRKQAFLQGIRGNTEKVSYSEAYEEVVADAMSTMLTDGSFYDTLMEIKVKHKDLFATIKKFFTDMIAKFKQEYANIDPDQQDAIDIRELKNAFDKIQRVFAEGLVEASENFEAAEVQKNTTEDGGVKMQTRTVNGKQVVWIENSGLSNKQLQDYSEIAKLIEQHIGDYYTIIESGQKVYIGEELPDEYTHSKYTSFLQKKKPALLKAKNRASTSLGEMIEIATNRRWEPTEHKDSKDAKYGMYRYDTKFAFPIKDQSGNVTNVKAYDAELIIRNASDGKKYLYDIVNIKEDTANALDLRQKEARKGNYKAATQGDVIDYNVSQDDPIVNTESAEALDLAVDVKTESVAPTVLKSERTWTSSDYVQERENAAREIAKAIGVTEQKAKDYIDAVNSIAKMIAEDRSRLDYFSSPNRTSFVGNVEYGGSFDFSTLCKKRRLLTGTFTAIQKALPNTALTADEILDIRNRMKEANLEVSCGLCYVEGSRANMGQFAKEFLRLYKQYYPDAWQPNMADVNTPDGIEWVRINHPECYEQYEYFWNHYGTLKEWDKNLFASQQKPKLYQLHTEYKGEILQKFKDDDNVEEKNLNGGIRLQSFSDFEIVHLIDTMQIIMDMSRVGLAGQAYTKVPDFAWALGDTGLKINLSLIAKGVDENGRLIFDDVEGMPIADAMKLRDRYSKNVGTILVAFNDEQLLAAMSDERVDFIIPFHRSQWKKSQYEAMGLPAKTKDYTFMQNEKYIKPQFHEYRGRMVKDKATNYMPNEYWDFSKSGKENAEAYLEMCARNNKRPKFYKLLQNNGDGSYSLKADGSTDGYWKLLIDFKMYDNEGTGSPQMAVKPEFNMEEANRMRNDYKGGHSNFPVAQGIVDGFVKDYKASHKGQKFSERDSTGKQITKEQQEFFKDSKVRDENGNLLVMYHGTKNGDFTVFDHTKAGKRTGFASYGKGNYFTVFENGAAYYGSRVIPAYLKIVNPVVTSANRGAFFTDVAQALGVKESEISLQTVSERIKEAGYDGVIVHGIGEDEGNIVICVAYDSAQIKEVSNKKPTSNPDIRYSERGEDSSNRSLLANAFEGITRDSIEYKMIQEYKGHIKNLNSLEKNLDKLNEEIRKIYRTPGKRDTARLKKLTSMAEEISKEITRHDKELLSLEASEPLRKVLQRERKKEAQKTKEHIAEIQQNKKVRAEQTEIRHKIRKAIRDLDKILNRGNKKQNVKEDLQPVVTKALQAAEILFTENYGSYDMLRNGIGADLSDAEEALVESCAKMLKNLDKMPTDGYENFQARQEAENRLKNKMSKLKDVFARERKRLNNTTVSSILGELADAYASLEKSEQSYVQGAYSEPVHNFLKNLQSEVGGTIVMDMTKDQLESVYAAYKMVLTTVRKANQMFNEGLKMSREQLGNAVIEEVLKAGGVHLLGTKMGDAISQFDWNNMKPVWVANRIGSDSFAKLMQGLFDGQYNFAKDIDEVRQFKLSMDEKYKPRNWDAEKQYEFESSTGKKFSLNLQQIMSLYAFSKREQAYSHLLNGGFVFEENSTVVVDGKLGIKRTYIHKGAASYKLNEATLNGILNSLTAEQKAYVDEMQKYLSDVMGAKGNEVSMQLYGIKMFNEKFYFPLRSSGAYMERAKEAELKKQQGQINLVNSGFTHSVKPEAKNPIVLSGFMDVWAEHCNEMSMYHSMVLPMEDFRKVYNYSTIHDENMESASVYQTIQDAYGKAATDYIDQLYKELNAGATVDPRETPYKKLISNFKKSAVMLSGSVVVQQFSSIGRAYAVIDPKYFIGAKVKSDTKLSTVDEMKKYAPVAIIKEMGGFDTGTKGNATAYIKAEKYGYGENLKDRVKDKAKGLIKDKQYRGDIMGFLPAWADEKTWCAIWEATKRETKAKNPKMDVKSDEFLKLAGERFSEVIEKTQVYDSVLARSANMRSKGNFMAMATAFLAEPTTTINLFEDAIRSGKAKNIARVFGSVAVSIVLNNALASIVYAMRDDDEDETLIEKYFQSFASGLIDDINPMSYYPFLKDVYSLFQGYDVERSDMSVIADVRDAMKQVYKYISEDTSEMDDDDLAKHNKNLWGAFGSLLDAGCSLFVVPVKNVRRDTLAIVNGIKTIGTDLSGERATTWLSFWDKVGSAAKDTIPIYAWTKDESKTSKLYQAITNGDKEYLSRLKSTYKTDSAYQSAVRKALRENDPRIKEAAQAKYDGDTDEYKRIFREIKDEGKFTFDDIMSAINTEENAIKNKLEPDKETSEYSASDFVQAVSMGDTETASAARDDIINTHIANGKTQEEAEEEFASDATTSTHEAYSAGLLDDTGAENMLVEYAGMDEDDAADKITVWDFLNANPDSNLSDSKVLGYLKFAESAGVSLDMFEQFINDTADLKDIKDKWGDVEVTKREQVLEVIDSLPISWQQKDALYLAYGYAESKIWDVPW